MTASFQLVLFDLDGTLIDSAPDLAGAANDQRQLRGFDPLPYEKLRPMVGSGARGMVGIGLGLIPGDAEFDEARAEFLSIYESTLSRLTHVFQPVESLLCALEEAHLRWGIVTNKIERYTTPVVAALGLDRRAAAVVCGDTTPHSKPHPAPLLEAARRAGVEPTDCVYVGDDLRDIQAGQAAGMKTVAVRWGYLGLGEPIEAWGADAVISQPHELLKFLGLP